MINPRYVYLVGNQNVFIIPVQIGSSGSVLDFGLELDILKHPFDDCGYAHKAKN